VLSIPALTFQVQRRDATPCSPVGTTGPAMYSTFNLNQFNQSQLQLLYCALDSSLYRTTLLIERNLPGKAGSSTNLSFPNLDLLAAEQWLKILSQQIDIEPSLAHRIKYQQMVEAIEDPIRAEFIAAAQPDPPNVVMVRIKYQLTDRGILTFVPAKATLQSQFEQTTQQMGHFQGPGQRIYVISSVAIGQFSVKVKADLT
jgi:hypothetical protein